MQIKNAKKLVYNYIRELILKRNTSYIRNSEGTKKKIHYREHLLVLKINPIMSERLKETKILNSNKNKFYR